MPTVERWPSVLCELQLGTAWGWECPKPGLAGHHSCGVHTAHRTGLPRGWSRVLVPAWGSQQEGPGWSHPRTAQVPSPSIWGSWRGWSAKPAGLWGQSVVPHQVMTLGWEIREPTDIWGSPERTC